VEGYRRREEGVSAEGDGEQRVEERYQRGWRREARGRRESVGRETESIARGEIPRGGGGRGSQWGGRRRAESERRDTGGGGGGRRGKRDTDGEQRARGDILEGVEAGGDRETESR